MKDKALETRKETCLATCDICHDKEKVILNLEMPGVPKENLDIKVDGDLLVVHGAKATPRLEGDFRVREISNRDYHHEFTIDDTINRESITASTDNGIVTITLGIKESEKPRKIEIA